MVLQDRDIVLCKNGWMVLQCYMLLQLHCVYYFTFTCMHCLFLGIIIKHLKNIVKVFAFLLFQKQLSSMLLELLLITWYFTRASIHCNKNVINFLRRHVVTTHRLAYLCCQCGATFGMILARREVEQ